MIKKEDEKEIAIKLRKQGKTYSEILSVVSVAKSTLAIWLGSVNLSVKQKQNITRKRLDGAKRGAEAKKRHRIHKQKEIILKSKSEIGAISDRELFLIGVSLYWAEGSKEKEYHPGSALKFANSDINMIMLFLSWLRLIGVHKERIVFDIYIHQNHKYRIKEVIKYWSEVTTFPKSVFRVYYKKNILETKRKNILPDTYFGLVRIYVKESSDLVRSINGWIEGIVESVK